MSEALLWVPLLQYRGYQMLQSIICLVLMLGTLGVIEDVPSVEPCSRSINRMRHLSGDAASPGNDLKLESVNRNCLTNFQSGAIMVHWPWWRLAQFIQWADFCTLQAIHQFLTLLETASLLQFSATSLFSLMIKRFHNTASLLHTCSHLFQWATFPVVAIVFCTSLNPAKSC